MAHESRIHQPAMDADSKTIVQVLHLAIAPVVRLLKIFFIFSSEHLWVLMSPADTAVAHATRVTRRKLQTPGNAEEHEHATRVGDAR